MLILEDEYPPDLFFGFRFWDIRVGGREGGMEVPKIYRNGPLALCYHKIACEKLLKNSAF